MGRKLPYVSTAFAINCLAKTLVHTDIDAFSDIPKDSRPNACAVVDHRLSYPTSRVMESEPKMSLGFKPCDPIIILDDDNPVAAEIFYIDLDTDIKASNKDHYTAPIRQTVTAAHDMSFPSVGKSHSSYNSTRGPDPARHTKRVTQPLFRTLTKDDIPISSAKLLPETCRMGFKAWDRTHDPHHTGNAAPVMQQKDIRQKPSCTLLNKERTKNKARADRDAPQFPMSVLHSKRKRTMRELGYNELISPAQIESPLEKLARTAKRRRQRQDMCDIGSQIKIAGDPQSAIDFDNVHGHEDGRVTEENVELAESPIVDETFDRRETAARVGDEHSTPSVVFKPSSVNTSLSTEGHRDRLTGQRRENHGDDHTNIYGSLSTQIKAQDRDTQERFRTAANSSGSVSFKSKSRKPRTGGPTNACGVFSPEKQPPVKRSSHGEFHCPRCDSQFTTSKGVYYHFEMCIAKHGNPKSLSWDDHSSLKKSVLSTDQNGQTSTAPARVPTVQENSTSNMHDIELLGRPIPLISLAVPSPALDIQAPGFSFLPQKRSVIEEQSSPNTGNEPNFDRPTSIVEYRATSGKGLSAETLRSFRETGLWDRGIELNKRVNEAQDEETEVPDIAYRYFVEKREWLETEEDAIESSMGPYHTLNEANTVAKAEVQCPQIDGFEGIHSNGWSYYYKQDEYGMQMHMATVLEISIQATVHRGK